MKFLSIELKPLADTVTFGVLHRSQVGLANYTLTGLLSDAIAFIDPQIAGCFHETMILGRLEGEDRQVDECISVYGFYRFGWTYHEGVIKCVLRNLQDGCDTTVGSCEIHFQVR